MSDALSAASLLMAVVAILYGAWYQEIAHASKIDVPKHDRQVPLLVVEAALYSRCLPLALMACVVSLVFLPTMLGIVGHAIGMWREHGLQSYRYYSAPRTAFCVVVLVGFGFAGHLWRLTGTLIGVRRRLKA